MKQVSGNSLKKNTSTWAIFSIINNAKINDKSVMGWKIIGGKKVTVAVYFHIIRKFRSEIVVKAMKKSESSKLSELTTGEGTLNFYLPEDMVLFQAHVKEIGTTGEVRIAFPEMIAQVDRRKHLRLFIDENISVELNFFKENNSQRKITQKFNKSCFDISGGGLSFIVSRTESSFFKKGDDIKKMVINCDNLALEANAKVTNLFEVEPNEHNNLIYKGWKICVKFKDLDPKVLNKINDFVFRHVDLEEAI